mmetsp:Transcript_24567/g.43746  ORF Transcript_24567/g.43746 Transcript_24567/m.43746 type:complete len:312 (-) Transcript_24567:22-957(-)|eukprot:CAMPEP_0205914838 /NCGR_PEP_ID=MMETSP1325-20131115/7476_1 /ASSEMBLY_ACC=CAM_ASM_000708 /TAXON_ID=236786 /ORGANISM="Florenciella sp., Strain RCC1007" /LENGTH=311 /DNA_ID=CAMNT_0053281935 /DNA_START=115 /DNA_END=1050 /DNA_ORIENTATION=+
MASFAEGAATTFTCTQCGKEIPEGNRQLHELRCASEVPATPAVASSAASSAANEEWDKLSDLSAPSNPPTEEPRTPAVTSPAANEEWDKLSDLSTPSNPATITTVEGGWAVVSEEGTTSIPRDPDNESVANLDDLRMFSDASDIDGDTISLASGENSDGEPQIVPPPRRRPPASARAARMLRPRPRIYTPTEEERAADEAVERRLAVAGKRVQRRRENQQLAGVPFHVVAGCSHADPVPGIALNYRSHFERLFEDDNAEIMARFAGGYNTLRSRKDKKRAEKDARRAASMGAEQPLRLTANPYATLSEEEG